MTINGKTKKAQPPVLPDIKRKLRTGSNPLGLLSRKIPVTGTRLKHTDSLLTKESCRLYILMVSKAYGYRKEQLNKLFESLIMSMFGEPPINASTRTSFKFGFISHLISRSDIIRKRDNLLFEKICVDGHSTAYKDTPPS